MLNIAGSLPVLGKIVTNFFIFRVTLRYICRAANLIFLPTSFNKILYPYSGHYPRRHDTMAQRWHKGKMAQWHDGTTSRRHNDKMAKWHNGTTARSHNGTMSKWQDGTMTRWHNGTMTQWQDGTMARLKLFFSLFQTPFF
jgi:hypothetical protein